MGMHDVCVLSAFLFTVVVDFVTELTVVKVLSELQYDDNIVLMCETIKELRNSFWHCMEAFECKRLAINLGETKVVVSKGIAK